MTSKKKIIIWILLILFTLSFLLCGTIIIIKLVKINGETIGAEAAIGLFSLVGTIIGAVFVVVELRNSNDVTCCQTLIELNNYFHDNERLMKVYSVLDKAHVWNKNDKDAWKNVDDQDVEFFCTFFENLYLLVEHHIARIKDLDNIFGYRFFLFMNNTYIQEKYLLTTSSSYVNLFKLYELWITYRDLMNKKGGCNLIVDDQNRFTKDYLKNKVYLVDNGVGKNLYKEIKNDTHNILIRDVWFDELSKVMDLQKEVINKLDNKELCVPLTRNEYIESLHLDYVLGAYDKDELVAISVIVDNRKSDRNLATKFALACKDYYTFDIVFVKDSYRGLGLQKEFIEVAKKQAKIDGAKHILTTVSKENKHSYSNLISEGFKPFKENVLMYGEHHREVLKLDL